MDLLLYDLDNLGKSSEVTHFIYTDTHIMFLEKGELYGKQLNKDCDFIRIAPDTKFEAISLDNITPLIFNISDKTHLHFYEYKSRKLASYALYEQILTCTWNKTRDAVAVVTKDLMIKTFTFFDQGVHIGELGENYLTNNNPLHGISVVWDLNKNLGNDFNNVDAVNCIEDLKEPTISWRGTGAMFAVNFYTPMKQKRVFKIFSKDCKYLFEGQSPHGLQSAMTWKPGSTFYLNIPIAQKGKVHIASFEKSGTIADSFELKNHYEVLQLEWTNDGEILCVLQKFENDTPLSLYFYKGRKWVLKQYLEFSDNFSVKSFQWLSDTHQSSKEVFFYPLAVLTGENLYKYVFKKDVYTTPGGYLDFHYAAFATVNDNTVQLSIFLENVVPLTNSVFEKQFPFAINHFLFHPTLPKFVIMDSRINFYLCVFSLEGIHIIKQYLWEDTKKLPFMIHHVYWGENDTLFCIRINENKDKLLLGDLKMKAQSNNEICFLPFEDVEKNLTHVSFIHNSKILLKKTDSVVKLIGEEDLIKIEYNESEVLIKVEGVEIEDKVFVFALTANNDFFVNSYKVLNSVTSFYVHGGYLVFTRAQGTLHCLKIDHDTLTIFSEGKLHLHFLFSLPIEVHSYILTGIPNSYEIVLFLARNKFETVKLRPLIVEKVGKLVLEKNLWIEAYDLLNEEDMSTDILLDLDLNFFLENIGNVFKSFGTSMLKLNKVIEDLRDTNVFLDDEYRCCNPEVLNPKTKKIELVCKTLLKKLGNTHNYRQYLMTIVICLIKGFPSYGVKEALYYISKLYTRKRRLSRCISDVLEYLSAKTNSLEVFQEVLFTFNIELVELAAQVFRIRSDVFTKFLDELKNLDGINQRLQIRRFITSNNFKDICRFGSDLSKLSLCTFDVSVKKIGIFVEDANLCELRRAEALEMKSCVEEACKIYEKCLGHLESTCIMLTKKKSFLGAVRVAKKQKNDGIIEHQILPAAQQFAEELYTKLQTRLISYKELVTTLVKIRESLLKRSKESQVQFDNKYTSGDGSSHEEYKEILQNIYEIVKEAFDVKTDVKQLCYVLLSCPEKYYLLCKKLHDFLYGFHVKIIDDLALLWPVSAENNIKEDFLDECPFINPPNNISINWTLPYFIGK